MIVWGIDGKGFPMLKVDSLDYWIQAFPVTKLQYEQFLVSSNKYGDNYYSELLKHNPRVSIKNITYKSYENVFITGVQLGEAKEFAAWLSGDGIEYMVPAITKWKEVYHQLIRHPRVNRPMNWLELSSDAQDLWDQFYKLKQYSNLAEQLLFKGGVLEWVFEDRVLDSEYGGMGRPRSKFSSILRRPTDTPTCPIDQEKRITLKEYGFRLMRVHL